MAVGSLKVGRRLVPLVFHMDARQLSGLADGAPFQHAYNLVTGECTLWGFDGPAEGGTRRPTYRAAGINGHAALEYDGVDDISYLYANTAPLGTEQNLPANPFDVSSKYPLTVFAVVQVATLTDANIIGQGSSSAGFFSTYHSGLGIRSTGAARAAITNNGGMVAEGGTVPTGQMVVLTAVLRSGGGAVRIEGTTVATTTDAGTPWDYRYATIGAADGSNAGAQRNPFDGLIGELRVYDGHLSAAEMASIETSLASSWS